MTDQRTTLVRGRRPEVAARDTGAGITPTSDPGPTFERNRVGWRIPASLAGALLVVPIVIAVGLTAVGSAWSSDPRHVRSIDPAELADEYGLRIDLVAVSAAGGVVDVRFTILDATKAAGLLHGDDAAPRVVAEGSGVVLTAPHAMRHGDLGALERSRYFVLFPNAGGSIQAGDAVSVVIADVRLEHVRAQG